VLYGTGDCSPTSQCRLCEGKCTRDSNVSIGYQSVSPHSQSEYRRL
jgi:hypothetical protein